MHPVRNRAPRIVRFFQRLCETYGMYDSTCPAISTRPAICRELTPDLTAIRTTCGGIAAGAFNRTGPVVGPDVVIRIACVLCRARRDEHPDTFSVGGLSATVSMAIQHADPALVPVERWGERAVYLDGGQEIERLMRARLTQRVNEGIQEAIDRGWLCWADSNGEDRKPASMPSPAKQANPFPGTYLELTGAAFRHAGRQGWTPNRAVSSVARAARAQPAPPAPSGEESKRVATKPPDSVPWMNYRQAAAYLGVSVGTLRNLVSKRRIQSSKRRGVVRFHRDRLDAWLRGGKAPKPKPSSKSIRS